jgi:hypothetical protein
MCTGFRLGLDVDEEEEVVPVAEEAAPVATEEVTASAMEEID